MTCLEWLSSSITASLLWRDRGSSSLSFHEVWHFNRLNRQQSSARFLEFLVFHLHRKPEGAEVWCQKQRTVQQQRQHSPASSKGRQGALTWCSLNLEHCWKRMPVPEGSLSASANPFQKCPQETCLEAFFLVDSRFCQLDHQNYHTSFK